MSNLTVRANSLGTGTVILESPNTNTNQTITLPDQTATLATTTDSITQAQLATALNASGSAPMFACRAWVNFNGTGTVAIRASGNVTSITDNGVGDYTVNFTTAMPDADYAVAALRSNDTNAFGVNVGTQATSSVQIQTRNTNNAVLSDASVVCVAVFR